MRAEKLTVRRYKTRHPLRGLMLLLLGALLGAGALNVIRGDTGLSLPFGGVSAGTPTLSPAEAARREEDAVLSAEIWYALQLGAFEDADQAKALSDGFRARGAAGYVYFQDRYMSLAAAYSTRADAQSVQAQLKSQHGVETQVKEIVRPEVTFHLSGQSAQLTALSDALNALSESPRRFAALASALDRGESGKEQAKTVLRSERDTAQALLDRLQTLFPSNAHSLVGEITDTMQSLIQALNSALSAETVSRLGAETRYCQLLCLCRLAVFAKAQAP